MVFGLLSPRKTVSPRPDNFPPENPPLDGCPWINALWTIKQIEQIENKLSMKQ